MDETARSALEPVPHSSNEHAQIEASRQDSEYES